MSMAYILLKCENNLKSHRQSHKQPLIPAMNQIILILSICTGKGEVFDSETITRIERQNTKILIGNN